MVNNVGFAPFAKTLLLKVINFTEEVLSLKPELPLPISTLLSGSIVVHLYSPNIDTLKAATQSKHRSVNGIMYFNGTLDVERSEDFPEGYIHKGVVTKIMDLVGRYATILDFH